MVWNTGRLVGVMAWTCLAGADATAQNFVGQRSAYREPSAYKPAPALTAPRGLNRYASSIDDQVWFNNQRPTLAPARSHFTRPYVPYSPNSSWNYTAPTLPRHVTPDPPPLGRLWSEMRRPADLSAGSWSPLMPSAPQSRHARQLPTSPSLSLRVTRDDAPPLFTDPPRPSSMLGAARPASPWSEPGAATPPRRPATPSEPIERPADARALMWEQLSSTATSMRESPTPPPPTPVTLHTTAAMRHRTLLDAGSRALTKGDAAKAGACFTRVLVEWPDDLAARQGRLDALALEGKFAFAARDLEHMLRADPSWIDAPPARNLTDENLSDLVRQLRQRTSDRTATDGYECALLLGYTGRVSGQPALVVDGLDAAAARLNDPADPRSALLARLRNAWAAPSAETVR